MIHRETFTIIDFMGNIVELSPQWSYTVASMDDGRTLIETDGRITITNEPPLGVIQSANRAFTGVMKNRSAKLNHYLGLTP